MIHILIHTILDLLKIVPFFFIAFLIMELLEHKVKKKNNVLKNKKFGPVIGSLLGIIPQCGFSVMATNLFSSKVITIGTLLAIYLSTSDEMLPLLISNGASYKLIISILLIKVGVAIIFGYLLDFLFKKKEKKDFSICESDNCHCDDNLFKSSIIHTLKISFFILITTLVLNILIYYLGEEKIASILLKDNFFGPFLASLVGLIPNCSASIILTELYLNEVITTGMLIGGLLTGSGVGILVLFKVNKDTKENLIILLSLYGIGSIIGILIDFLKIVL
ncbi:MAG: arsenic efflux protein, partial [Bacilli bacterium]|nr:arsenic efflux protein [Bacilli bacterium]